MAVKDSVFQLNFKQRYIGIEVLNVFFYKNTTASPTTAFANLLGIAVRDYLQTTWANMVSSDLLFEGVTVRNLFDDAEFAELPSTVAAGTRSASSLSSYNSIFIPFRRSTAVTRSGGKRFCGLTRDDLIDNVYASAFLILADAFADKLDDNITFTDSAGASITIEPVLVKRIPYTAPSGKPAYRLPTNLGESVTNRFVSNAASRKPSTQNSRKS